MFDQLFDTLKHLDFATDLNLDAALLEKHRAAFAELADAAPILYAAAVEQDQPNVPEASAAMLKASIAVLAATSELLATADPAKVAAAVIKLTNDAALQELVETAGGVWPFNGHVADVWTEPTEPDFAAVWASEPDAPYHKRSQTMLAAGIVPSAMHWPLLSSILTLAQDAVVASGRVIPDFIIGVIEQITVAQGALTDDVADVVFDTIDPKMRSDDRVLDAFLGLVETMATALPEMSTFGGHFGLAMCVVEVASIVEALHGECLADFTCRPKDARDATATDSERAALQDACNGDIAEKIASAVMLAAYDDDQPESHKILAFYAGKLPRAATFADLG